MENPCYIDVFSGCGGLALGFHNAGWKGLFAIEKSPHAFETLKYNMMNQKHHFEWPDWLECSNQDINIILSNHKEHLTKLKGTVDLVAGGPPCQGFSMAGKRIEDDIRNQLVYSYIEFIKLIMPSYILFENVKGFTYAFNKKHSKSKPYSEIVINELKKLGYDISYKILDFANYGVPQSRKRFILVGSLNSDANSFFEIINTSSKDFLSNKGLKTKTSVSDAISDLLTSNGTTQCSDRPNYTSGLYGQILTNYQNYMRSFSSIESAIPDSHSLTKHSMQTTHLFRKLLDEYPYRNKRIGNLERTKWNIKKRGVTILDSNDVSPTLTTHPDDYIHYSEPRILTVREYARLQSFPDWYQIKGKYTTGGKLRKYEVPRYTQIGNAIPPLFAELAGLALKRMYQDA